MLALVTETVVMTAMVLALSYLHGHRVAGRPLRGLVDLSASPLAAARPPDRPTGAELGAQPSPVATARAGSVIQADHEPG